MKKIKALFTKHERLAKSITLLLLIVSVSYVGYGLKQAFKNYDIQSIEGKRYSNKTNSKFIYFNDESNGMYIYDTNGAAEFFTYSIKDGKIDLIYLNKTKAPTTYYLIKDGRLFSRKFNIVFYEFQPS